MNEFQIYVKRIQFTIYKTKSDAPQKYMHYEENLEPETLKMIC